MSERIKKPDGRGGPRKGAGRPKNEIPTTPRYATVYGNEEQWAAIDEVLAEKDIKLSTLLNDYLKKLAAKQIKSKANIVVEKHEGNESSE
ncbi:hypothetical protein RB620_24645 [Paenibacillus sp. LHD-117]|uniref:hypothetical protein n=1 Tax=Paenibacillus sp. LHD-117 TaxID=3071412 RepID=UPI0027E0D881|nr:hypothetical protein [Paenibacillus sp. LHD-117]MDQ6422626.1 hypothetical protein [Paenibacillus sp. LHD-117]